MLNKDTIGGGGGGVTSFNTRAGAVVPVAADYTALQVTPTAGAGQDFVIPGMTVAYAGPLPPAGWGIDAAMMAAVPLPPPQIWILKA